MNPSSRRAVAASATLEMAMARRVPTLRNTGVVGESEWEMDGVEQFIRRHDVALVVGVELRIGNAASAANGDEFNLGVVHKQGRRRVGGGRSIDEIAADGGAALVGDGADPACDFARSGKCVAMPECARRSRKVVAAPTTMVSGLRVMKRRSGIPRG